MSVAGQWTVTMDTPLGKQQVSLTFAEAGGNWTGTLSGHRIGTAGLTAINVAGSSVTCESKVNTPMGVVQLALQGTVEGDSLSGVCKTTFGNANFTGVRS